MGYVIAAYAVVVGGLLAYGAHLVQERRALGRALSKSASPGRNRDPG